MPTVATDNYREFEGFINEAVDADLPYDQKVKNLNDLTVEVKGEDGLSTEERWELEQRLCDGLWAVAEETST